MNYSKLCSDRLSDLTDEILSHILCFLPTKDAARTSILSPRWRCLFLSLPKIRVEENNVTNNMTSKMASFVDRWLSTPPLTEFLLRCRRLPEPRVVVSWIHSLLSHNVKTVDITKNRPSRLLIRVLLPIEIFSSKTLEVLKIRGRSFVAIVPDSSRCPNLKVLHLNCSDIRNDSGNVRFWTQGFPLLEDLSLSNGSQRFGPLRLSDVEGDLIISSTTLKRLAINYICTRLIREMNIDAPKLQKMMFQAGRKYHNTKVIIRKCESLESAYLQRYHLNNGHLQLLRAISDGSGTFSDMPHFPNLVHLELSNTKGDTAWDFLDRAPNLETLIYNSGKLKQNWPASENIPICLAQSLGQIILRSLCCEEEVLEGAAYVIEETSSEDEYFEEEESSENNIGDRFLEIKASMMQLQNLEQLLPEYNEISEDICEQEESAKEESHIEEEMSDAKIVAAKYFLQNGGVLEKLVIEHPEPCRLSMLAYRSRKGSLKNVKFLYE